MKQQYKVSTITMLNVLLVAVLGVGILFQDQSPQSYGEYQMPNRA